MSSESQQDSCSSSAKSSTVPRVVKFAYTDFQAVGVKWKARCNSCGIYFCYWSYNNFV